MSKRLRPIRSLLFAPANRPELIAKFPRYAADAFAIDLEDGTPESEKDDARRALPGIVASTRERNLKAQLFVRINAYNSRHAQADLAVVLALDVDGVILPKLETPAELKEIESRLDQTGRSMQVVGVIETARGAVNVETLAGSAGSVMTALAFGAEDFMTDLGGLRTPEGLEVLHARSRVVLAARAAGLQALDLVYVNIRDDEGFRRDATMGRQLGYSGKMCIIPRQVEIVNEVFSPSSEEIERARRLIAAYESAQSSGRGVFEFEGAMVDEPILKRARGILELSRE